MLLRNNIKSKYKSKSNVSYMYKYRLYVSIYRLFCKCKERMVWNDKYLLRVEIVVS
jgi:hypothetical protein